MNFLALCQRTASESGTIAGTLKPSTVLGQTDRLGKLVGWVAEAWRLIQEAQPAGWPWQREEFSGKPTTPGSARYTGASWSLLKFGRFVVDDDEQDYCPYTIYLQADGVADERILRGITWADYKIRYTRGVQTPDYPVHYTIHPQTGEFCLGPVPDAIYAINGEFVRQTQILGVNADIPEMPGHRADVPEDEHIIIVWRALMILHEFDEGAFALAAVRQKYLECYGNLVARRLPRIEMGGGPIA